MTKLRTNAEEACRNILGEDIYNALRGARYSLPEIMDSAAKTAFLERYDNENTDRLREAMWELRTKGILED